MQFPEDHLAEKEEKFTSAVYISVLGLVSVSDSRLPTL